MNQHSAKSKIYYIKEDSLDPLNVKPPKKEPISTTAVVKKNSLSGLLAHYNSDSETEDVNDNNKLDIKVDSFLQEINQINKPLEKSKNNTIAWQECFDESSGYPYYWNIDTNQVTWEMPPEYKVWLEKTTVPQPPIENVPAIKNSLPEKIESQNKINEIKHIKKEEKMEKKKNRKKSDSDDEKIVMITSFCEDSTDEESEKPKVTEEKVEEIKEIKEKSPLRVHGPHVEDVPKEVLTPAPPKEEKKEIIETIKEEVDETVILARLRTQAKVLQELDGELPESVDRLLNSIDKNEITPSLSLVAGYGDDSENEDPEPELKKSLFPIPEPAETIQTDNTLFPATKPIDINQFAPVETEKIEKETTESVDTKVFKRKKRIAFDVLPTKLEKKPKIDDGDERLGFGFKSEENANDKYINFKKGGVAFVKTDLLEPVVKKDDDTSEKNLHEIQEIVSEKVNFLCEGKAEVSAVQIMSIQLKTLEAAHKSGGLTDKYLFDWLRETSTELAKLEKDAAPEGWLCEWDRSNQRYYYRNNTSGETQWEYPEIDIVGGGEAMDICSTPPPEEVEPAVEKIEDLPIPSPPVIRGKSPTPPPPPKITDDGNRNRDDYQPPLPPMSLDTVPPPPPPPSITSDQPLPPGVDAPDVPFVALTPATHPPEKKRDSFGSELDSFYSDIAMIEATSTVETKEVTPQEIIETVEAPVKKKKKKSKLGQGITMKKKNVSNLVEKWKKVQNDYL